MLEKLPDAVGEALEGVRAGLDSTLFHAVDLRQGMAAIELGSLAFGDHQPLPTRYTADGAGLSPPLHWRGAPAATAELVLIVEDADSPTPAPLVHAIAHALPLLPDGSGALAEGALCEQPAAAVADARDAAPAGRAVGPVDPAAPGASASAPLVPMGRNSLLQLRWLPPDPPPGHGLHRYVFQLFALAPGPALPEHPGRDALRQAVIDRGLASGCLIGTAERPSGSVPEVLPGSLPVS